MKSGIEWTDTTWSPVIGCTKVSQGCKNCYAEREVETRWSKNPRSIWYGRSFSAVAVRRMALDDPLKWKKPRRVFVCPRADLFHEAVPEEFIMAVFAAMARAPQHTYQVLTKRALRMRDLLRNWEQRGWMRIQDYQMPSNVWLGVSVEDHATADERIPLLLQTPAAVRWVSAEPLLGSVDLREAFDSKPSLDWVVAGAESGPKARPMHPDWGASLRDQCKAAGVPFLFKQWGEWMPEANLTHAQRMKDIGQIEELYVRMDGTTHWIDPDDTTPYNASDALMVKAGKRSSGRLLDGVLHDAYPEMLP